MPTLQEQINELAKKISDQTAGYSLQVILRALKKAEQATLK